MDVRTPSRPGHPYFAGSPLLVAHRGGARLAPENTLLAFRRAIDVWEADMIELDVRLSRDGEVMVIHDATVDRTTNGSGRVEDLTFQELSQLDAGHRFSGPEGGFPYRDQGVTIPGFREVLEAFPGARLNVEIKARAAALPLVELIRIHGAEHRTLVAAYRESDRRPARGYQGPWGASSRQARLFLLLHRTRLGRWYTPRCDTLQVPEAYKGRTLVTPRFLAEARRRNIPVHVWTVDDPEAMRRLLAMGVDAIHTDRPDVLARVLVQETGRALPPGLRQERTAPDGAAGAPSSPPRSQP